MKLTKDHADYWLSKKSPNVIKDSVDKKSIPSIDSLINSQVKTPINQKNWERRTENAINLAKSFRSRNVMIFEMNRIANSFCTQGRHIIYKRWLNKIDKAL